MAETIEYGKKYRVKPEFIDECLVYENVGEDAEYIIFDKLLGGGTYTSYTIYNKNGIRLDSCSFCLKAEHVEPYESVARKTKLSELHNTVVRVDSEAEYDELMGIFHDAGWTWCTGDKPRNFYADSMYQERKEALNGDGLVLTVFKHDGGFFWRRMGDWAHPSFSRNPDVISLDRFKIRQGLKPRYTTATEAMIQRELDRTMTATYASSAKPLTYQDMVDACRSVRQPKTHDWFDPMIEFEIGNEPGIKTTLKRVKESIMQALREVPKRLQRALDKGKEAMYQLGWINGDLEYTEDGTDELLEFLHDEYEEKMGALAIKRVAEAKKKAKECKSCE